MTDELRINISLPKLTIEEQLQEVALGGKCMIGFFNQDGNFVTWWPIQNLSYMERLFMIDSFEKRLEYDTNRELRGED